MPGDHQRQQSEEQRRAEETHDRVTGDCCRGSGPVEGEPLPDRDPGRSRGRRQHGGGPESDQRRIDQVWPSCINPPNGSVHIWVRRQQELVILCSIPVD